MKKSKLFLFSTVLTFATSFVACSSDDTFDDPVGTVALNMLNEDNGQTRLGNSDVYISNANNFYSRSCVLTSLGKKNGLGYISDMQLVDGTNSVAVDPGNTYQVFNRNEIREFHSGTLALPIISTYYNVYVVSQIKQENEVVGANVKFALMDVPDHDLPEWGYFIGTLHYYIADALKITIELPTSDFEYEAFFGNQSNEYELTKDGKELIVDLIRYSGSDNFEIFIRIKNSYTYVKGAVN